MKVKLKQREKRFSNRGMQCRCCTRIDLKDCELDKQILKEALEETMVRQTDS